MASPQVLVERRSVSREAFWLSFLSTAALFLSIAQIPYSFSSAHARTRRLSLRLRLSSSPDSAPPGATGFAPQRRRALVFASAVKLAWLALLRAGALVSIPSVLAWTLVAGTAAGSVWLQHRLISAALLFPRIDP